MASVWTVFKLAARAAVWRPTRELPLVGLPSLLGWTLTLGVVRVALQYFGAGATPNFDPYGLNAVVAWLALELAIAALFVRPPGRVTALAAMVVLSLMADVVIAAIRFGARLLAPGAAAGATWTGAVANDAILAAEIVWWVGAMLCVLRSVELGSRLRLASKVAALWLALFVANALVPHVPVYMGSDFDVRNANWWEYLRARTLAENGGGKPAPQNGQTPQSPQNNQAQRSDQPQRNDPAAQAELARIDQAQAALLQAEVDHLAPQRKGVTDVYAIGLAGWAEQDVFLKELDGGLAAVGNVLPIQDRTIRLVNHRDTLASVPLANVANFFAAVHAVGSVMDKDEDVLALLMTSHGDRNGFALQLPGKTPIDLTPQQVAWTLDTEGIKYRVVIVSSCYAGIFLPPLANDNSIVLTAADDKSTSFGCAPEREWTYFGDALFRQSLRPGTDFKQAFEQARTMINFWEQTDRLPPSNPQGHFGPALVGKLAPFFTPPQSASR